MISELCNIVGGSLKSKFCDVGLTCDLSTPSFTAGSDFTIEAQHMARYERLAFRHQQEKIFVEVGVKIAEGSEPAQMESEEKEAVEIEAPESIDLQAG